MRRILPLALLTLVSFAGGASARAATDPTEHQIYAAVQAGHLAEAEQMVNQVLRDYPSSARAHYVAAEVYARAGNFATARTELNAAESLKPGLPFASERSVRELQAELSGGAGPRHALPAYARPRPSVPWGLIIAIVLGVAVAWALLRRRNPPYAMYPQYPSGVPAAGGPGAGGPVPPYGAVPPYSGSAGSGILGGLASGLALGAGVAAGEELVRHMIDRPGGGVIPSAEAGELDAPAAGNEDMGGQDFGLTDNGGSWDDGGSSWSGDGGSFGGDGGGDWT